MVSTVDTSTPETLALVREKVAELALSDTLRTDWAATLCSAPSAITVLGDCALLSSVSSASLVRLDFKTGPATLPTKLFECNTVGRKAFVEAHARMNKINSYAANIGPTIDKILLLLQRPKNGQVAKAIDIFMRSLQVSASTTTTESNDILTYFEAWQEFTRKLAVAISGKRDDVVNQEKETTDVFHKNESQLKVADRGVDRAQRLLQEQEERLRHAESVRDQTLEDGVEAAVFVSAAAGATAGAAAGVAVGASAIATPWISLAALAAVNAPVLLAQAEVKRAREHEQRRKEQVEAVQSEREQLQVTLNNLRHENLSLKDIQLVLRRSIRRLQTLQQNVEAMLLFFRRIQGEVENLTQTWKEDFVKLVEVDKETAADEKDKGVQDILQQQALDVKLHYTIIQKLAYVYGEVSERFILRGFNMVDNMSSSESSLSDQDVADRDRELEDYRSEASDGIEQVTQKHQRDLMKDLQSIVEENASCRIQEHLITVV